MTTTPHASWEYIAVLIILFTSSSSSSEYSSSLLSSDFFFLCRATVPFHCLLSAPSLAFLTLNSTLGLELCWAAFHSSSVSCTGSGSASSTGLTSTALQRRQRHCSNIYTTAIPLIDSEILCMYGVEACSIALHWDILSQPTWCPHSQ